MRPAPATIQPVSTMEHPMMKVALLVSLGAVAASCLASAASNLPLLRAGKVGQFAGRGTGWTGHPGARVRARTL